MSDSSQPIAVQREANIERRRRRIKASRAARKYSRDDIQAGAILWSRGVQPPLELVEAGRLIAPHLYAAADKMRAGDVSGLAHSEAHKALRVEAPGLATAYDRDPDSFFQPLSQIDRFKAARPAVDESKEARPRFVATIYENSLSVNRISPTGSWRAGVNKNTGLFEPRSEAAYIRRVERNGCQLISTCERKGVQLHIIFTCQANGRRLMANWRKQKERAAANDDHLAVYGKTFPLAGDQIAIINSMGEGDPLPIDAPKSLWALFYEISDTPEGKNSSSFGDYGGDYAGTKGDGRRLAYRQEGGKSAQVWGYGKVKAIKTAFERQGYQPTGDKHRFFIEQINPLDSYHILSAAAESVFKKGGHESALPEILALAVELEPTGDVTDFGQGSNKPLCPKSVTWLQMALSSDREPHTADAKQLVFRGET